MTVPNLFAGIHSMTFSSVARWLTPANQTIAINSSQRTSLSFTSALDYSYALSASQLTLPAIANGGVIALSANSRCGWTTTADVPWISITQGASGNGAGTTRFTVAANTSTTARSGTLTIAGQAIPVAQVAPGWFAHPVFGWLWDTGSGWWAAAPTAGCGSGRMKAGSGARACKAGWA